ncbi:hypothetical protein K432DRAFT_196339 [Lepidopterella palustris CBS 459.81]|uniref:Uncharacterized protein n=1 Tax=Lepidopterella palustris CBS 459.81 TaxID=1314670 RepID=A0A8E2JHV1_9PEZI|nr:hypothetical protein K432DRAFT_196339 [Lepidopterella palustris CBS 459.81]
MNIPRAGHSRWCDLVRKMQVGLIGWGNPSGFSFSRRDDVHSSRAVDNLRRTSVIFEDQSPGLPGIDPEAQPSGPARHLSRKLPSARQPSAVRVAFSCFLLKHVPCCIALSTAVQDRPQLLNHASSCQRLQSLQAGCFVSTTEVPPVACCVARNILRQGSWPLAVAASMGRGGMQVSRDCFDRSSHAGNVSWSDETVKSARPASINGDKSKSSRRGGYSWG